MKKYFYKKPMLISLGVAALIAAVAIIVPLIKPSDSTNYKEYAKKTNIFTMNNKTMALDEAYFITKNKQAYYEEYYYTYGTSFSWDVPVEMGKTYEDIILEETLTFTKEVFLLSEYALENGLELNESEQKVVASNASSFLSASDSKILKATNATEELVNRVYTRTTLYDKVCAQILKDKDLTIDPEDARQCLVGIVEIDPQYFTSPERIAEKIAERVNGDEAIGEVASIYDATLEKINVGKDSDIIDEMKTFCLSLEDDQCKTTEINGIYYAVYCYLANDELVTASTKEALLAEKKSSYITAFVEELLKETPVSINMEAWETVNFDTPVYTKSDIVQSQ